ncbi:MAG: DNA polymerase III subunit gamma and tau [Mycobacteriales bacterium]
MAHLALYRKYRPQTFEQLIGQEHVTTPLISALSSGKLHHAYLFSGPRGCGKTSSARILARSLNCEQGPTPLPCGTCPSCRALAIGGPGSLDVVEIDAASHGGVDDARELRERAFFAPAESRFKIYVIDEAHMVSSAGFNALLKLVEEPPDFVTFVFATTEPEKVLPTIKSRTHHYPFRLVPQAVLRPHLERICEQENVTLQEGVIPLVVRAGGGSVRDALSVLDQLASGADAAGISYRRAVALLGVTDSALLDQACDALAAMDGAALLGTVDQVAQAGHDPRRFAADLLERLRDLLILDKVPDAASLGLIDAPSDQLERMSTHALRLGSASLSRMADLVHDGLAQMKGTTSARLVLELVCARMLLPAGDTGTAAILQRLERLERRLEIAQPVTPTASAPLDLPRTAAAVPEPTVAPVAAPSAPAPSSSRESEVAVPVGPAVAPAIPVSPVAETPAVQPSAVAAPIGGEIGIEDVRRLWPELLERLKRRRVVWSLMQNATPIDVSNDALSVVVGHQGLVRRFADSTVTDLVTQTLHELLGVSWKLRAAAAPPGMVAPNPGSTSVASDPEPAVEPEGSWQEPAPVVSDTPNPSSAALSQSQQSQPKLPQSQSPKSQPPQSEAHALLQRSLGARVIAESDSSVR